MVTRIAVDGTRTPLTDAKLKTLQAAVGGYIELLRLTNGSLMYVNEDGRRLGLPMNAEAGALYGRDTIVGDVVLVHDEN